MSASSPPPPAYNEVYKTSSSEDSNPNWQAWYSRFIGLKFSQDEAVEYTKLFVINEIDINMTSELSDNILKSIGIEKAGHRIRILRLQNKNLATATPRAAAAPAKSMTLALRCAWHPSVAANEKCRKCGRLLCLNCRRQKSSSEGTRYYCENCFDDCTIL